MPDTAEVSLLESVRSVVCRPEFTWDCQWALDTTLCESSWRANAQGIEGSLAFNGLWQVWNGPFDPYLNTVEAHVQYVEWQEGVRVNDPWPNCP